MITPKQANKENCPTVEKFKVTLNVPISIETYNDLFFYKIH